MSSRTIPKKPALILVLLLFTGPAMADEASLGRLSANPYDPESTGNPYGAGNPYAADSINNPYGRYGNPYSNQSTSNPYATDAPKLYDDDGTYRGRLSANPYDPESVSNPYGRYGNPYSPDSINNPYGAGNPYRADSPTNPYGNGLRIYPGDSDGPRDDDDLASGFEAVAPALPDRSINTNRYRVYFPKREINRLPFPSDIDAGAPTRDDSIGRLNTLKPDFSVDWQETDDE